MKTFVSAIFLYFNGGKFPASRIPRFPDAPFHALGFLNFLVSDTVLKFTGIGIPRMPQHFEKYESGIFRKTSIWKDRIFRHFPVLVFFRFIQIFWVFTNLAFVRIEVFLVFRNTRIPRIFSDVVYIEGMYMVESFYFFFE